MEETFTTWRELLKSVISERHERQRIASALGMTPITLTRWATNQSDPRPDNLLPLIDALPRYREVLIELIREEFPLFFQEERELEDTSSEIPSPFYRSVLHAFTQNQSIFRVSSVYISILQQALNQLDPRKTGMVVLVAQLVPPRAGQMIRSVHTTIGRGNYPWPGYMEHQKRFLGTESPVGRAITERRLIVVQNAEERAALFPGYQAAYAQSEAAFPILLGENFLIGCLYVASTRAGYLIEARQKLIQDYAALMVLAFEQHEFYHTDRISLGIMPSLQRQQPLLDHIPERIKQKMLGSGTTPPMKRLEAEQVVWQELEDELLALPFEFDL